MELQKQANDLQNELEVNSDDEGTAGRNRNNLRAEDRNGINPCVPKPEPEKQSNLESDKTDDKVQQMEVYSLHTIKTVCSFLFLFKKRMETNDGS